MIEFKVGDLVRLNSSKQPMSIVELDQANGQRIATCVWISGDGKEARGTYPVVALVAIKPNEPRKLKLDDDSGPAGPQGWMR